MYVQKVISLMYVSPQSDRYNNYVHWIVTCERFDETENSVSDA